MSVRPVSPLSAAPLALALALGLSGRPAHAQPHPLPPAPPPLRGGAVPPEARAGAEAETLEARLGAQFAPSGGLTADDVAQRAATTSFDVRARQAEIEVASASVDQALYSFFPRLTLQASYTRLSPITPPAFALGNGYSVVAVPNGAGQVAPGPVTDPANQLAIVQTPPFTFPVILDNYLLTARLTVPISDYFFRLSQAYSGAQRTEAAALYNERAARLKTASDARTWYYQWVSAKLSVVATEQSLVQRRAQLIDAQRTFQAGTSSRADVLNAEARVADAELLLERQKNFAVFQEERLRTVMHDTSGRPYEIGEDVRLDPPGAQQPPPALPEAYNEALSQRLELRALDETALSLRDQAKVARAGAWPRLDGFGDITTANPNQRFVPLQERFRTTWSVGLQLSWSPNDAATSIAAANATNARAAQVEAQRSALRDALRQEIVSAQNGLREAQVAVDTSARSLSAAEESYRVRRELFRNGRATNLEVTNAENDLLFARLNAINARVNLRIALVSLDHALGRDAKRAPAPAP
ncbi:MAG TPA: TolC family protein [Polyangiaceae bacterium]|nr:TolC family protein [Polyangiaceae bacterium]